jgi:hypothetical protein
LVGTLRGRGDHVGNAAVEIERRDTVPVAPGDVETILVEGHVVRPELLMEFSPGLGRAEPLAASTKAQEAMFDGGADDQRPVRMKGEAVWKAGQRRKSCHLSVGAR